MSSPERLSPSDHIKENQIHVYDNNIVLDVKGASWAAFTDTNSMDPFFDETANSIEIRPASSAEVNPGDVISYRSSITDGLIVHRVISKGVDSAGDFFIVKGDNNPMQDPEKIRFNQIHGVLIGIIY
ncbi:MAG: signal peptidase I [Candidatus Woesearchaeota archaeon]